MDYSNIVSETGIRSSIKYLLKLFSLISIIGTLFLGTLGCESSTESEDEPDVLRVKFTNDQESAFTLSNIQLQPMGRAGESTEPTGEWGDNILTDGKRLAPGEHEMFNLDIPNGDWSRYRIGVINSQGNEIMLHEQPGYSPDLYDPSITHWGSDDRTVSISVSEDQGSGLIYISAWSDHAGIED